MSVSFHCFYKALVPENWCWGVSATWGRLIHETVIVVGRWHWFCFRRVRAMGWTASAGLPPPLTATIQKFLDVCHFGSAFQNWGTWIAAPLPSWTNSKNFGLCHFESGFQKWSICVAPGPPPPKNLQTSSFLVGLPEFGWTGVCRRDQRLKWLMSLIYFEVRFQWDLNTRNQGKFWGVLHTWGRLLHIAGTLLCWNKEAELWTRARRKRMTRLTKVGPGRGGGVRGGASFSRLVWGRSSSPHSK